MLEPALHLDSSSAFEAINLRPAKQIKHCACKINLAVSCCVCVYMIQCVCVCMPLARHSSCPPFDTAAAVGCVRAEVRAWHLGLLFSLAAPLLALPDALAVLVLVLANALALVPACRRAQLYTCHRSELDPCAVYFTQRPCTARQQPCMMQQHSIQKHNADASVP